MICESALGCTTMLGVSAFAALALGLLVAKRIGNRELKTMVGVGVGLRMVMGIGVAILLPLGFGSQFGFDDDARYFYTADSLSHAWAAGDWILPEDVNYRFADNPGYPFLLGVVFSLFGSNTLAGLAISIVTLPLGIAGTYLVGKIAANHAVGRSAAWLLVLVPDQLFWSSLLVRDASIAHAMIFLMGVIATRMEGQKIFRGAVLGTGALLLPFRPEIPIVLVSAFIVARAVPLRFPRANESGQGRSFVKEIPRRNAVGGLALLFSAGIALVAVVAFSQGFSFRQALSFHSYVNFEPPRPMGFLDTAIVDDVGELWKLPLALFALLFTPFPPWGQSGYPGHLLLAWLIVPWLFIVPAGIAGGVVVWRKNRPAYFMTVALWLNLLALAVFLFAFSPERHRVAFSPLVFIGAAAAWFYLQESVKLLLAMLPLAFMAVLLVLKGA